MVCPSYGAVPAYVRFSDLIFASKSASDERLRSPFLFPPLRSSTCPELRSHSLLPRPRFHILTLPPLLSLSLLCHAHPHHHTGPTTRGFDLVQHPSPPGSVILHLLGWDERSLRQQRCHDRAGEVPGHRPRLRDRPRESKPKECPELFFISAAFVAAREISMLVGVLRSCTTSCEHQWSYRTKGSSGYGAYVPFRAFRAWLVSNAPRAFQAPCFS